MASIFNLTPVQIAVISVIIGIAFGLPFTVDEQNVFGNVLLAAGYAVLILAAQRTLISNAEKAAQTQTTTQSMQQQLNELQRMFAELPEVPQ